MNNWDNTEDATLIDDAATEIYGNNFERMRDRDPNEQVFLLNIISKARESIDNTQSDTSSDQKSDPRVDTRPWESVFFEEIKAGYLVRSDKRTEFIAHHKDGDAWVSEDNRKSIYPYSVGIEVVRYEEPEEEKSPYADFEQLKNLFVDMKNDGATEMYYFALRVDGDQWRVMSKEGTHLISEDQIMYAESTDSNESIARTKNDEGFNSDSSEEDSDSSEEDEDRTSDQDDEDENNEGNRFVGYFRVGKSYPYPYVQY